MRGKRVGTVSASLVLIAGLLAASGALAEEVQDPTGTACIGVDDDADCGQIAIASGGDATCEERYCLAATPEGNATCEGTWCTAATESGNASGFFAVAGTGDSEGPVALSGLGDADGIYVAASGVGDANGIVLAASGTGEATGFVALSATGDATSDRLGIVAVSGTGNTSADIIEINGMQDADGCWAVSGTGSADASCSTEGQDREASGCDTGEDAGTDAACRDPNGRQELGEVLVCDTDLSTSDGDGHGWCAVQLGACVEVIWGPAAGPIFVGGHNGCQAGLFYDEDGHDHAPLP